MFVNPFKHKKDYKQLGKTLVAMEFKGGKIPEHCDGIILHTDGSFDRHPEGDELKANAEQRLLLLHKGPYTMQFAPNDQAPEAGLEIELQAEFENELGLFLSSWDKPQLSTEELQHKAKQLGGPYLLQPGMTQQEIDQPGGVCAQYSNAMQAYGFRCRRMQRKDLQSEINTADILWQDLTAEQIEVKATATEQQALELELGALPAEKKINTPLFRLQQFDQKLTTNLQRELSYSLKQSHRISSTDTQQTQYIEQLQQQLHRCQLHSQMLPPLKSTFKALKLSKAQQRARLKQLQQAANSLKQLKIGLSLTQGGDLSEQVLSQLLAASDNLEYALKKRAGKER